MFTAATWAQACDMVTAEMRDFVNSFVTPISIYDAQSPQFGAAWGTGNYVIHEDRTFLITAEHNFSRCKPPEWIAHLPDPQSHYVPIPKNPITISWPVDAASVKVQPLILSIGQVAIPQHLIATHFQAVEMELFFLLGFPGTNLKRNDPALPGARKESWFGVLQLEGKPITLQRSSAVVNHEAYDQVRHVVLDYPAMGNKVGEEGFVDFPHPKGLSGSFLWNTRYLETVSNGNKWTPADARVCGLVIAALEGPQVILASRIEDIRAGLTGVFA